MKNFWLDRHKRREHAKRLEDQIAQTIKRVINRRLGIPMPIRRTKVKP